MWEFGGWNLEFGVWHANDVQPGSLTKIFIWLWKTEIKILRATFKHPASLVCRNCLLQKANSDMSVQASTTGYLQLSSNHGWEIWSQTRPQRPRHVLNSMIIIDFPSFFLSSQCHLCHFMLDFSRNSPLQHRLGLLPRPLKKIPEAHEDDTGRAASKFLLAVRNKIGGKVVASHKSYLCTCCKGYSSSQLIVIYLRVRFGHECRDRLDSESMWIIYRAFLHFQLEAKSATIIWHLLAHAAEAVPLHQISCVCAKRSNSSTWPVLQRSQW